MLEWPPVLGFAPTRESPQGISRDAHPVPWPKSGTLGMGETYHTNHPRQVPQRHERVLAPGGRRRRPLLLLLLFRVEALVLRLADSVEGKGRQGRSPSEADVGEEARLVLLERRAGFICCILTRREHVDSRECLAARPGTRSRSEVWSHPLPKTSTWNVPDQGLGSTPFPRPRWSETFPISGTWEINAPFPRRHRLGTFQPEGLETTRTVHHNPGLKLSRSGTWKHTPHTPSIPVWNDVLLQMLLVGLMVKTAYLPKTRFVPNRIHPKVRGPDNYSVLPTHGGRKLWK